jgi:hypothetical protein
MSVRLVVKCDCCGNEIEVPGGEFVIKRTGAEELSAIVEIPIEGAPEWCSVYNGELHMCDNCVRVWAGAAEYRFRQLVGKAIGKPAEEVPW